MVSGNGVVKSSKSCAKCRVKLFDSCGWGEEQLIECLLQNGALKEGDVGVSVRKVVRKICKGQKAEMVVE